MLTEEELQEKYPFVDKVREAVKNVTADGKTYLSKGAWGFYSDCKCPMACVIINHSQEEWNRLAAVSVSTATADVSGACRRRSR